MDTQTCHSLLLERIALRFGAGMRKYRVPAIAGMVFGMLAYLFFFTNKLVNHDEVQCLFDKGATFSSGRWGLRILEFIFPNYSMPWLYGIITIVLITLSVCLMVSIFSIRTPLLQVLLAGTVIVFLPSLAFWPICSPAVPMPLHSCWRYWPSGSLPGRTSGQCFPVFSAWWPL